MLEKRQRPRNTPPTHTRAHNYMPTHGHTEHNPETYVHTHTGTHNTQVWTCKHMHALMQTHVQCNTQLTYTQFMHTIHTCTPTHMHTHIYITTHMHMYMLCLHTTAHNTYTCGGTQHTGVHTYTYITTHTCMSTQCTFVHTPCMCRHKHMHPYTCTNTMHIGA